MRNNTSVQIFIIAILSLYGCAPLGYIPQGANPTLITEKGEKYVSVGTGLRALSLDAAYGVSKRDNLHISLLAGRDKERGGQFTYGHIFANKSKAKWSHIWEGAIGYGMGEASGKTEQRTPWHSPVGLDNFIYHYSYLYHQGTLRLSRIFYHRSPIGSLGFGLSLSGNPVYYPYYNYWIDHIERGSTINAPNINTIRGVIGARDEWNFFVTPAATFRLSSKRFSVNVQLGFPLPLKEFTPITQYNTTNLVPFGTGLCDDRYQYLSTCNHPASHPFYAKVSLAFGLFQLKKQK